MSLSPREPDAEEIERKWTAIWENRVKELPLLPDPRPRALTPDPSQISATASKQAPRPLYQESASWFKVPANIRRDILRLAFGDARLHMYMEYGYPDVPRDADSKYHCNIVVGPGENSQGEFRLVDKSQSKSWHWWGSRCHRYFPVSKEEMGPMTRKGSKGPWEDYCRDGGNDKVCKIWRRKEGPLACQVGIMGWLLSCRQNYFEAISVLYSTNTLILNSSHMIIHLPQLILPQRLKSITSLEITWPFDTKFSPEQSYDNLNQDHVESVLGLLSSEWFTSLRRLYLFFDEGEAWLARDGIEVYSKVIFDHMDAFARRMTHLHECAFAIPDYLFRRVLYDATTVEVENGVYELNNSYQQVWRDIHGNVTAVQLPYVDSYPKAPYHLPQGDDQVPGYWVLEADTLKVPHTPPSYTPICRYWGFDDPEGLGSGPSPSYIPVSPWGIPDSPTSLDQPNTHGVDH